MKLIWVLLAASTLYAADSGRIVYSKKFPKSVPEFQQVTLDPTGAAEYKEAPEDELPMKFKLSEAEVQQVYDLAGKLDHFKHPLEAPVKVAFMGTKTFRYENGAAHSEVEFNY